MLINEDFIPKRERDSRLPPGQYKTNDFPVLSMGPTPEVKIENWKFEVFGLVDNPKVWNWKEFNALPITRVKKDIHCVTKWSKFDTSWSGVLIDDIIKITGISSNVTHLIAYSYDGYTTNIPIEDIVDGKSMIATRYEDEMIESEHGGPARLLIPHLYFWKSAKWIKKIEFTSRDKPGFWETNGYHNYGDPWKEQRYTND